MKKVNHIIINKHQDIIKYLIILSSVFLIFLTLPEGALFEYDFKKNTPWSYDDLFAEFDFPVSKSESEYQADLEKVREKLVPFYLYDSTIVNNQQNKYSDIFQEEYEDLFENIKNKDKTGVKVNRRKLLNDSSSIFNLGLKTLLFLYKNEGIIKLDDEHTGFKQSQYIKLQKGKYTEKLKLKKFRTLQQAKSYIESKLNEKEAHFRFILSRVLDELIEENVNYNQNTTETFFENNNNVLKYKGSKQKGQKLISKGDLVTDKIYLELTSYQKEYNLRKRGDQNSFLINLGFLLLIVLCLAIVIVYLYQAQPEIFKSNSKISFILFSIVIFTFIISVVKNIESIELYVVPLCILPILIRAFFDTRTAFFTLISLLLLTGLIVPNSFEYVFLNTIAGIFAIYSIRKLHYRNQFFITSLIILLSYCIGYLGISLVQTGSIEEINYTVFILLTVNVLLTLITFPLIPFFEFFGFISEITIFELTDPNKPLLKELNLKAPGTFQHSLQVSNLSEAAAIEIGANPLISKVGALYHDIGKMKKPEYYIENQHSSYNPHDEEPPLKSAEIIIDHVYHGIELGKEYKLPEMIIDFIRTHHGTSRVEYFLHKFKSLNPEDEVDESLFTYPGPVPFSKETAILMFADSVEASSRSLKDPNNKSIEDLVDNIFKQKIDSDQLINANITFKEISQLKKLFKKMLKSIYHIRVSYPQGEK